MAPSQPVMSGIEYKIGHAGRMVVSKPAWSAWVEESMREVTLASVLERRVPRGTSIDRK
jgi:hypothetical protein